MAKFKVGDVVKDKGFPLSGKFKIVQCNPDGTYAIKPLRGGSVTAEKENYLVAANSLVSTNAVVAKALAARNVRVSFGDDVKVGDEVSYEGHGRWQGMDGKVTRIISDDRIEVRFKNGEFKVLDTDDVVKNALAARGAVAGNDEVAVNWQRKEDFLHVESAINDLVGVYNNYKMGRNLDVDRAEEGAYKVIHEVIQKLHPVADVFRRERKN